MNSADGSLQDPAEPPYYAWYDGPNRGFFGIRF